MRTSNPKGNKAPKIVIFTFALVYVHMTHFSVGKIRRGIHCRNSRGYPCHFFVFPIADCKTMVVKIRSIVHSVDYGEDSH